MFEEFDGLLQVPGIDRARDGIRPDSANSAVS